MSTKKTKQVRDRKPKKRNVEPEVFVLPPDILQKLGINLGNIVGQNNVQAAPTHIKGGVNSPIQESSVQHTNLHLKDKGGESTKKRSSILETAILMKKSVLLSPTFTMTGSYIPGELEMSIGTELDVESKFSLNIDPIQHNVNTPPKPLNVTHEPKQLQCKVKQSASSNNVSRQVKGLETVNKQRKSKDSVQSVPNMVIGNHKLVTVSDDHTDEAYLSDCSSTNSSHLQNTTTSMKATESMLKKRSQSNVNDAHEPNDKIEILPAEKQSSSQFKKLQRDNVAKASIPVSVDAVKQEHDFILPAKENTTPPCTTATLNSVGELDSDVFNEIDAAQQLIELADIINVSTANIPIAQEDAVQNMFKDTEKLCLDTYTVQDKPDVSIKLEDETIDLENNESAMENPPDVPLGSDVSIDFMVTNIDDHMEGEDEILDNLVKHLDSNDMIESNNQEMNVSDDSLKISEEIMVGSDCSEINVSLDDIELQSIENSFSDKGKFINTAVKTFYKNSQTGLILNDVKTILATTHKECVASSSSDTEKNYKNRYSENNLESAYLSELDLIVDCNVPKPDVHVYRTSKQDSSNLLSFPCNAENRNRHCAAELGESSPLSQGKKKLQTKLDRYFTVTPKCKRAVKESKDKVSITYDSKEKVGEIAMILKQIINTRSSQARPTNANRYLCSQGEEEPGGSGVKVYKRKPKKCNAEIKVNVCQTKNNTKSVEDHGVKVYSRKARKSRDMKFEIDVRDIQPDLEETEQKFCNCGDFGSLIYYDCFDVYEHIHFWSHRSTNCSAEDIFLIYEDEDSSFMRNSSDKFTWEDDVPQNVSSHSICWHGVDVPKNACKKKDKILKKGTENAQFVENKQENDGKIKCDTDSGVISTNTDKIETNNDNKLQESELRTKEPSQNVDQNEELTSVAVVVLNDSGEDNLNAASQSTKPVSVSPAIADDNSLPNSFSADLVELRKSKSVKPDKMSMKMESKTEIKESKEFYLSLAVNQQDAESKRRRILKSALSLKKSMDVGKPSTSAKTEIACTSKTQPDVNTIKRLTRKLAVSGSNDRVKPDESFNLRNSQKSRKQDSSRHKDENTDTVKRKSLRSADERVKETKVMDRKTSDNETHEKSLKGLEKGGKNTNRSSKRKATETPSEGDIQGNVSESVPPSKKSSRESRKHSRRIASIDVSPDEDTPLSSLPSMKSRKRRMISSDDESLTIEQKSVTPSIDKSICKQQSVTPLTDKSICTQQSVTPSTDKSMCKLQSVTPSTDTISCGVCSKEMEEEKWFEHVAKEHGYLAWKDGETPLDTADEKSVSRHLTEVLKKLGTLTCSVCGFKRKSVRAYLQHKPKCEESAKMDSRDNSYIGESHESSGDSKRDSVAQVKCGVCHETVAENSWINHIQITHDYMAWKDCDKPLDLNNEEEVFEHLYAICKEAGSLICKKCGIKRVYIKKYLDHCRSCDYVATENIPETMPEIEQPDTTMMSILQNIYSQEVYTCGVCSKKIVRKKWPDHKMVEHYNVAWIEGEPPLDTRKTSVIEKLMKEYTSAGHKLSCKLCGLKRASRIGFYAHVIVCGKTEEEADKLKLTCTICNKKFLAIYESQHYGWHKQAEASILRKELEKEELEKCRAAKLEVKEEFVPGGRRRAAAKAIEVIQKYKTDNAKSDRICNVCGFEANKRDELKRHMLKCSKPDNECDNDNFDASALDSEEESEESFSGDTENESESDAEEQTATSSRKKEVQHDNSTRYPRKVANVTRFLQQSSKEFCQFHLSGANVYPSWRNCNIEVVPETEVSKYMQPAEMSCKVKVNEEWTTFKKFTAKKIKVYCVFVGSAAQAVSWAPPLDDGCNNYLAVSCHRRVDVPRLATDDTAAFPGLVQIWDYGTFDKAPVFALGLAHEHGVVWAIDWCPSGAQDPMPEDESQGEARMGLLAMACSNGAAYIYSVPYPPVTADHRTPILKLQPVVELRLSMRPERKRCQATALRWSPQKDHALIVVGYSDGTTAYYDLQNDSPLLATKENDVTVIFPYYDEMALSNTVADVDIYPSIDPSVLAGAVCSGSPAGGAATLLASQPTRLASNVACRSTKFQPLWPAVMVSSDSSIIRSVASEMEWTGHGRNVGSGGISATCLRCTNAIFHQQPLLRLMMPHPSGSEIIRKSLASIQVVELKKQRKQELNDSTSFVEPTTYEEAVQLYGLEFLLNKSQPSKCLMMGRDGWSPRFPLGNVQGMAFCPSAGHHHRCAVATFAGLVFLVDTSS